MRRNRWFVLLAALLLLAGFACSGGSKTSGPAAAVLTNEPSPPAAAQTTATATATQSPGATSGIAPSVTPASESPDIVVQGSADFVDWTSRALDLIRTKAPEWHDQVTDSIDVIVSVPSGSGIVVQTKTFRVGDQTAHAPGYNETKQLIWYAGTIVHDSCHSERYEAHLVHNGKDGEIACLMDQKAALLLMDTDAGFTSYIQSLIDGADNPANQYWNNPNRHW
jgi:hypothetical protein